jgi:hypothetical protein
MSTTRHDKLGLVLMDCAGALGQALSDKAFKEIQYMVAGDSREKSYLSSFTRTLCNWRLVVSKMIAFTFVILLVLGSRCEVNVNYKLKSQSVRQYPGKASLGYIYLYSTVEPVHSFLKS